MGVKVEIVQIKSRLGKIRDNYELHASELRSSTADCVVFPELSLTGYVLRDLVYELVAEAQRYSEKLSEEGRCAIFGTLAEVRPGIIWNAAGVVVDGKLTYVPKFFLPTYGLFEERRYFQPGDPKRDLVTFRIRDVNFGVVICEDAWHPEPIEALARMGADLVFVPSASPVRRLSQPLDIQVSWQSLLRAHSLMNGVWTVFSNMVGAQEEEFFWGGSFFMSPRGKVTAEAPIMEESRLLGNITLDEVRLSRRFSSFRDHIREFHEVLRNL